MLKKPDPRHARRSGRLAQRKRLRSVGAHDDWQARDQGASSDARQIEVSLARYTPMIETQLREARARLRSFFARGDELVFDNYNALVFGISPTERTSDAFISVAGYPKWVTLFFLRGVDLHDPGGLLAGEGKKVRSVRLKNAAQINTPEVEALVAQAFAPHAQALSAAPALVTIVKAVSARQGARRPA